KERQLRPDRHRAAMTEGKQGDRMTMQRSASLLAALGLLLGGRAHAGLLDSPALSIGGQPGKVVYRMGPVYYDPGHVDTVVSCTNIADGPTGMVLEIFDENDVLRATAY